MTYRLRLDMERIRRNMAESSGTAEFTDDDLYRALAARGVWRIDDQWWGVKEEAVRNFGPDEIIEQRRE